VTFLCYFCSSQQTKQNKTKTKQNKTKQNKTKQKQNKTFLFETKSGLKMVIEAGGIL
jgi:hypothetical protein